MPGQGAPASERYPKQMNSSALLHLAIEGEQ